LIRIREKNNKYFSILNLRVLSSSFIKTLRQKYLVFLFFAALSTLAWYIRALGDNYIADVKYPIHYSNLPLNCKLSKSPPAYLNLQIDGEGFAILSFKLRHKNPLNVDVSSFNLLFESSDSIAAYTLTKFFYQKLANEFINPFKNLKVLDILPDTLFLNFTNIKTKQLPVNILFGESKTVCDSHHMFSGDPFCIPPTVSVSGPYTIIDTLRCVNVLLPDVYNLKDTFIKFVLLDKIDNRLVYSINTVKVVIPVDKYCESQIEVPVTIMDPSDSIVVKIFPKKILIKYRVTLNKSNSINADIFKPFVETSSIENNQSSKLVVKIGPVPSFLKILRISPEKVEYLIENKSAKNWNNWGNR
jgi:hypothetical protein